jgi:sulfoxide reductase heme-binding subunit YedZ
MSLGPFGYLGWAAPTGHLSANPLSDLTNETGIWTLRFLCVTLGITPLRTLTGWNVLVKFRRMAGLYAFFLRHDASIDVCHRGSLRRSRFS